MNIPQNIAKVLNINLNQVDTVLKLFSEEATIPFIARYRKEHTGGLDEDQLREIENLNNYLTLLEDRKAAVIKSIDEQGKLTGELKEKILAADNPSSAGVDDVNTAVRGLNGGCQDVGVGALVGHVLLLLDAPQIDDLVAQPRSLLEIQCLGGLFHGLRQFFGQVVTFAFQEHLGIVHVAGVILG